ncbi:hypothetical protein HZC32_03365 [Candidatus Woesearchaeota archaeon]|nr:hypothetical protein [Candidatus Woesearchaeota archaeon]
MEDVGIISELLGVDFFLLMHDPRRVDRFLNRIYFERMGTWRTEIFPHYTNIVKEEKRAKTYFYREKEKRFPIPTQRGLLREVYKVYIPLGKFFHEEINLFLKDQGGILNSFFDYVDQHKSDPLRNYFLTKYEEAMFEWIYEDYMYYCHTRNHYHQLKKKLKVGKTEGLEEKLKTIYQELSAKVWQNKDGLLMRKLKEARVNQSLLANRSLEGSLREWQELFNYWLKKTNQEKRIKAVYKVTTKELDKKFDDVYDGLKKYLSEHGLKVVLVQNNFAYVQGKREDLTSAGCPFILLEQLEKVYLTEHPSHRRKEPELSRKKVYYPPLGFWEGLKEEEDPTYRLTTFEMKSYANFIEKIFLGDQAGAIEDLFWDLDTIRSKKADLKDLVWYSKKKARYHAFEDGEKIWFHCWDLREMKFDEGKEKNYLLIEKKGKEEKLYLEKDEKKERHYFIEKDKKRVKDEFLKGRYLETEKKVYIMNIEELKVDWNKYRDRIGKRAEILLEPIVGINYARKLVREGLNSEGEKLFAEIKEKFGNYTLI